MTRLSSLLAMIFISTAALMVWARSSSTAEKLAEFDQVGGTLAASGTPEELTACEAIFTGRYLRRHLRRISPDTN